VSLCAGPNSTCFIRPTRRLKQLPPFRKRKPFTRRTRFGEGVEPERASLRSRRARLLHALWIGPNTTSSRLRGSPIGRLPASGESSGVPYTERSRSVSQRASLSLKIRARTPRYTTVYLPVANGTPKSTRVLRISPLSGPPRYTLAHQSSSPPKNTRVYQCRIMRPCACCLCFLTWR
jgi:hypothetical protein